MIKRDDLVTTISGLQWYRDWQTNHEQFVLSKYAQCQPTST